MNADRIRQIRAIFAKARKKYPLRHHSPGYGRFSATVEARQVAARRLRQFRKGEDPTLSTSAIPFTDVRVPNALKIPPYSVWDHTQTPGHRSSRTHRQTFLYDLSYVINAQRRARRRGFVALKKFKRGQG